MVYIFIPGKKLPFSSHLSPILGSKTDKSRNKLEKNYDHNGTNDHNSNQERILTDFIQETPNIAIKSKIGEVASSQKNLSNLAFQDTRQKTSNLISAGKVKGHGVKI